MIENFNSFISERFKPESLNFMKMSFKFFELGGNLMCFVGDEEKLTRFAESLEENKELLQIMKNGVYTCGVDLSKFGYEEIDTDKLSEIKSSGKNKAAVFINSEKQDDENVKTVILKASMKLDLNKIEME